MTTASSLGGTSSAAWISCVYRLWIKVPRRFATIRIFTICHRHTLLPVATLRDLKGQVRPTLFCSLPQFVKSVMLNAK